LQSFSTSRGQSKIARSSPARSTPVHSGRPTDSFTTPSAVTTPVVPAQTAAMRSAVSPPASSAAAIAVLRPASRSARPAVGAICSSCAATTVPSRSATQALSV
jgi:hypothetical protein